MPLFLISKGIDHPGTHADRDSKNKRHSQRLRWERKGHLKGEGMGKENKGRKVERNRRENGKGKVTTEKIQL